MFITHSHISCSSNARVVFVTQATHAALPIPTLQIGCLFQAWSEAADALQRAANLASNADLDTGRRAECLSSLATALRGQRDYLGAKTALRKVAKLLKATPSALDPASRIRIISEFRTARKQVEIADELNLCMSELADSSRGAVEGASARKAAHVRDADGAGPVEDVREQNHNLMPNLKCRSRTFTFSRPFSPRLNVNCVTCFAHTHIPCHAVFCVIIISLPLIFTMNLSSILVDIILQTRDASSLAKTAERAADICIELERPTEAIDLYLKSITLFERAGLNVDVAPLHASIALTYQDLGRLDDALTCVRFFLFCCIIPFMLSHNCCVGLSLSVEL